VYTYLIRRILYLIPVMLIVVPFVFFMVHFIPGDPAAVMAGSEANQEEIEYTRRLLGLDRPIYEQYGRTYQQCLDLARLHFDFKTEQERQMVLSDNAAAVFNVRA
jgi:ABC-type dipeptide/oligopeptide/nickel transport system permease component